MIGKGLVRRVAGYHRTSALELTLIQAFIVECTVWGFIAPLSLAAASSAHGVGLALLALRWRRQSRLGPNSQSRAIIAWIAIAGTGPVGAALSLGLAFGGLDTGRHATPATNWFSELARNWRRDVPADLVTGFAVGREFDPLWSLPSTEMARHIGTSKRDRQMWLLVRLNPAAGNLEPMLRKLECDGAPSVRIAARSIRSQLMLTRKDREDAASSAAITPLAGQKPLKSSSSDAFFEPLGSLRMDPPLRRARLLMAVGRYATACGVLAPLVEEAPAEAVPLMLVCLIEVGRLADFAELEDRTRASQKDRLA